MLRDALLGPSSGLEEGLRSLASLLHNRAILIGRWECGLSAVRRLGADSKAVAFLVQDWRVIISCDAELRGRVLGG